MLSSNITVAAEHQKLLKYGYFMPYTNKEGLFSFISEDRLIALADQGFAPKAI